MTFIVDSLETGISNLSGGGLTIKKWKLEISVLKKLKYNLLERLSSLFGTICIVVKVVFLRGQIATVIKFACLVAHCHIASPGIEQDARVRI
jgi:hypothetical protein